jgi:hypothetical protein
VSVAGEGAAPDDADLRRESERICQLIEDLGAMGGAPVRQRAEELVSRLVHLYGTGLGNLMAIVGPERLDDTTRARLAADPLVSSLLVLHGIHPDAAAGRAYDPDAAEEAAPQPVDGRADRLVQIDLARGRSGDAAGAK